MPTEADPKAWLDYGALGVAALCMFLSMGLTFWTVRWAFSLIEKTTKTIGLFLDKLHEENRKDVS